MRNQFRGAVNNPSTISDRMARQLPACRWDHVKGIRASVLLVGLTLVLVACGTAPFKSEPVSSGGFGIPYHLPTSIMAVEISILRDAEGNFRDIAF